MSSTLDRESATSVDLENATSASRTVDRENATSASRTVDLKAKLAATPALRATGRVLAVTGLSLRFSMPGVRVGDVVHVKRRGEPLACEVVGFAEGEAVAMPLGALTGVGPDDEVEATGGAFLVRASSSLLGRVVDGLGRPLD